MDYIVGVISLVTLGLNYFLYKRITATYPVGTLEETVLDPVDYHDCCKVIIEHLNPPNPPEVKEVPKPPEVKNSDAYSPWKNQTGIPMVPQMKPPEPIVQPPNRGPLARPDGFV